MLPRALLIAVALAGAGIPAVEVPQAPPTRQAGAVSVTHLETDAARDQLGIDDRRPILRWRLESAARGVMQRRFQVRVASAPERLADAADLWDSGPVASDEPGVEYAGAALARRTRYYWTARVWTDGSAPTAWAAPAWFETAMLEAADWRARWIAGPERRLGRLTPTAGQADDERIRAAGEFCRPPLWPSGGFFPRAVPNPEGECREIRPAPMLRRSVTVNGTVAAARLYVSALGYGAISINGTPVSGAVLDPALTDYSRTVLYGTHDVTPLVRPGENVLGVVLGSGHFDSSTRTWDWGWDLAEWRATPRLRLELHLRLADGREQVVVSDGDWSVSVEGPWRYDSYYLGETYDARRELAGWDAPGFDASSWQPARLVDAPAGVLRAQALEPVRVVAVREPGVSAEPVRGVVVYDVGQNLTGWARVRVSAPPGTPIEILYSEKRNDDGRLSTDVGYALVGGQLQTDYYVAKGTGDEVWTPRFSYKGFQYVQLSAPGGRPLDPAVSVRVERVEHVRTAVAETATFESDSGLLDRIHRNTRWALASNLHGVITDTPVYEKNPWTGDAQLSAGTLATLFDAERLFAKVGRDMLDAQTDAGELPLLVPSNEHYGYVGKPAFKPVDCCGATPAWDAVLFVVPWEAYERFGDRRGLAAVYPAMRRYMDQWIPQWTGKDGDAFPHTLTAGLGDWDVPEGTPTNIALSSSAYYAHAAQLTARAARALGRVEEAAEYERRFERIRRDFNARFLSPDGVYRDKPGDPFTHTAQVLPLAFGLAPDHLRESLVQKLADDITGARGGNPWVGVLGARYLLPVLTAAGGVDVAFAAATQTDYPSWGYWVDELKWTALGEHWEATTRSRNHHFFGTIVQWMHESLGGVRPLEPGFRRVAFRPELPASLARVSTSFESVRGTVGSAWRKTPEGLEMDVTVPPNATAVVYVPATAPDEVTEHGSGGAVRADAAEGVRLLRVEAGRVIYEIGSGRYRFRVRS